MKLLCSKWIPDELKEEFCTEFDIECPEKPDAIFEKNVLFEKLADADIFFSVAGTPVNRELMDAGRKLRMIASLGVGYDHVDVAYANERKLPIVTSPTMVSDPTAEHTIALIMGVFHNLYGYTVDVKKGIWENHPFGDVQTSVCGRTLGIVGMGRIGRCVARKAVALGMKVQYFDPYPMSAELEKEMQITSVTFDELLRTSDCVTVHVPFTKDNYHMFNEEKFAAMKDGAYFVNASRGVLVDLDALTVALKSGKLKGVALDTFEPEPYLSGDIFDFQNVILTPHVASETRTARVNMARECLNGLVALCHNEKPGNLINPESL